MTYQHKSLAAGRWKQLSLCEQMANIGSEIQRTVNWKRKGNMRYQHMAFDRALELMDLTMQDEKNFGRLREVARTREACIDHFVCDNEYNTTDEQWCRYFLQYAYAARRHK